MLSNHLSPLSSLLSHLCSGARPQATLCGDGQSICDDAARDGAQRASGRRRALMPRLARMMRRIALRRDEIDRLADNYAAAVKARAFPDRVDTAHPDRAFLPSDLFDPAGSWGLTALTEPRRPTSSLVTRRRHSRSLTSLESPIRRTARMCIPMRRSNTGTAINSRLPRCA